MNWFNPKIKTVINLETHRAFQRAIDKEGPPQRRERGRGGGQAGAYSGTAHTQIPSSKHGLAITDATIHVGVLVRACDPRPHALSHVQVKIDRLVHYTRASHHGA